MPARTRACQGESTVSGGPLQAFFFRNIRNLQLTAALQDAQTRISQSTF